MDSSHNRPDSRSTSSEFTPFLCALANSFCSLNPSCVNRWLPYTLGSSQGGSRPSSLAASNCNMICRVYQLARLGLNVKLRNFATLSVVWWNWRVTFGVYTLAIGLRILHAVCCFYHWSKYFCPKQAGTGRTHCEIYKFRDSWKQSDLAETKRWTYDTKVATYLSGVTVQQPYATYLVTCRHF